MLFIDAQNIFVCRLRWTSRVVPVATGTADLEI